MTVGLTVGLTVEHAGLIVEVAVGLASVAAAVEEILALGFG